jgi:hypothetical protein
MVEAAEPGVDHAVSPNSRMTKTAPINSLVAASGALARDIV